jgi:hypothetical protein
MLKLVGLSGQIAVGKDLSGQYFDMTKIENGDIYLKAMAVVPQSDAWFYKQGVQEIVRKGKEWSANNPIRTDNTDEIIAMMEAHIAKKEAEETLQLSTNKLT